MLINIHILKNIRPNQTLRYHFTAKYSPTNYILDENIVNLILDHLQDNYVNDISTSDSEDETENKRTLLNFIKKKQKL